MTSDQGVPRAHVTTGVGCATSKAEDGFDRQLRRPVRRGVPRRPGDGRLLAGRTRETPALRPHTRHPHRERRPGPAGGLRQRLRRGARDGRRTHPDLEEGRLVRRGRTPGLVPAVRRHGGGGRRHQGLPGLTDVRPVADGGLRAGAVRTGCGGGQSRTHRGAGGGPDESPASLPGRRRATAGGGPGRECDPLDRGWPGRHARPVAAPAGRGQAAGHRHPGGAVRSWRSSDAPGHLDVAGQAA